MFEQLMESRHQHRRPGASAAAAIVAHVVLIGGATAIQRAPAPSPPARPDTVTVAVWFPAAAPRGTTAAHPAAAASASAVPGPVIPGRVDPEALAHLDLPDASLRPGRAGPEASLPALLPGRGPVSLGDVLLQSSVGIDAPELLGAIAPAFPAGVGAERLRGGEVEVRYVVDSTGRVPAASVEAVRADAPAFLVEVKRALAEARFRPARSGGRAVAVRVTQRFTFQAPTADGQR